MKGISDIYNLVFNENSFFYSSHYYRQGEKLIRFSDHLPKTYNLEEHNEGVKEVLFVYVNSDISESKMIKDCEKIHDELDLNYCDFLIYDENCVVLNNLNFLKNRIEFFLNN